MDPSALIFVALAVAWAVYLIPKALEHHEAGERARGISSFSHRLRVLGRRDAVSRGGTALVAGGAAAQKVAPPPMPQPDRQSAQQSAQQSARPAPRPQAPATPRAAAVRATKRRRNVLAFLLVVLIATVGAAVEGVVGRIWIAAPVLLLAAWLVACRLMVRKEHAVAVRRAAHAPAMPVQHQEQAPIVDDVPATSLPASAALATAASSGGQPFAQSFAQSPVESGVDSAVGSWDPVDVPLPTYVHKPAAARRTVRTIDLDSTGVWSSGRNEADSALAREADATRQSDTGTSADRKTGS